MEPWQSALARGEVAAAWDLFIERYRPLILATIRRTLQDDDDVFEVFADVCQILAAEDLARLRRYDPNAGRRARFSTWLVVVVRNRTIDWVRSRSGRRRVTPPVGLTGIQQEIFRYVIAEKRSHLEAFALLENGPEPGLTFRTFLRELAETYRAVEGRDPRGVLRYLRGPPGLESQAPASADERLLAADARTRLAELLDTLPDDTRLAVQLFVVDELPATDVARTLGWPNAKAVYNRVTRALAALRRELERQGLTRKDL